MRNPATIISLPEQANNSRRRVHQKGDISTMNYSHDEDASPYYLLNDSQSGSNNTIEQTFPFILHEILTQIEYYNLEEILSWQPHGRAFRIHNKDEFSNYVLKCWFRQSSFASFQRQLNIYRFRCIRQGTDKGAYFHDFFLRGKP